MTDDIAVARRVLETEAEALKALALSLDGAFSQAIARLTAVKGRVVVTGMGKSGHVGRKIAATLASTGTPAFFVHPGEASHGDLGMVTADDAVVALSNSGETTELGDIVAYTRGNGIVLIAMTGRADSALARAADVALILPAIREACPHNLAPTTSTTLMLALGDALAVALLERKGFTPDQFGAFHPGGKLGQRLLTVGELMHGGEALPVVGPDTPMAEAIVTMSSKRLGCVAVADAGGHLLGIVTDGDLRRNMGADLLTKTVGAVMNRSPLTVTPGMRAADAVRLMNDRKITILLVEDGGRLIGLLHVHDCLRAGVE